MSVFPFAPVQSTAKSYRNSSKRVWYYNCPEEASTVLFWPR